MSGQDFRSGVNGSGSSTRKTKATNVQFNPNPTGDFSFATRGLAADILGFKQKGLGK